MNDNELISQMRAQNLALAAQRLAEAKAAALAEGKEPLSLEVLDRVWPWNPDNRDIAEGYPPTQEERLARWEHPYYIGHAEVRTTEEFALLMNSLDLQGAFE